MFVPLALCAALTAGAAAWRESARAETEAARRLDAASKAVAAMAADATARDDHAGAASALKVLSGLPDIAYARIEASEGTVLAEAGRPVRLKRDVAAAGAPTAGPGLREVPTPIVLQGRRVGELVLLARSPDGLQRMLAGVGVSLFSAILALGAGLLLAQRMARDIEAPVRDAARELDALQGGRLSEDDDPFAALAEARARLATGVKTLTADADRRLGALEHDLAAAAQRGRIAEEAADARAEVLARLHHDFRAPLGGLAALAAELEATHDGEARSRLSGVVARSGAGLLASLDALIAAGGRGEPLVEADLRATDPVEIVEDVASLFLDHAAGRGLDLAVFADPSTPKQVMGDPSRLRQVVTVLVAQALRVTETGGVLVEVEPDSPASLRICVRDTSPGVPREEIAALVANSPGLAACRQAVESMGGRLLATSQPGRGATLAVHLPVETLSPAAPWPPAATHAAPVEVAVDGVATRRALGRYLARTGYRAQLEPDEAPVLRLFAVGSDIALAEPGCSGEVHIARPIRRQDLAEALRRLGAGTGPAAQVEPAHPEAAVIFLDSDPEPAPSSPAVGDAVEAAFPSFDQIARPPLLARVADPPPEACTLLAELDEAIAADALSLVYQPQFDRDGRSVVGVEALIRWVHPTRGPINPSDFIPIAEAWGSIEKVTDWVMRRVAADVAAFPDILVSFNVSALEFASGTIVRRIARLLKETGVDPHRLEVEITETAILDNEAQVRANMLALRELGLQVTLDDFGAGYSSLGHLRRYPFDKLKIDREFVTDCTRDLQSAAVVHAVVSIGRALGMKVVAEGVETEQQRQFLRIAGVHAMQGFLFGRPGPAADVAQLIDDAREGRRIRA